MTSHPRGSSGGNAVPPALRRMRLVATGLLVAMAAVFVGLRLARPPGEGWGYVRAFAEAAMVGGLADWFAVTALFRHPLGLPIPHTAIIPRNKERIAATLAQFLRDNFLIPRVVARRLRRLDIAAAAGRWLANPNGVGEGRLRRGASRLAADLLEALDEERMGGTVKAALATKLRELEVAPFLGRALASAIAEDRHLPLLQSILRWAAKTVDANEDMIREMVSARAGAILRWTGLDANISNAVLNGIRKLVTDMVDDPAHPLRAKAEEGLAKLADDLQHDPAMQARVMAFKAELVDNPALADWWQGVWERARAGMLRIARDPDALTRGRFGEALRQLGATLQDDPALALTVNRFVRRAAVGAVNDYGDAIVRIVSDTIRGWDARTLTARLENTVGRDLQYIRINGTLVGGSVGVLIHALDAWL